MSRLSSHLIHQGNMYPLYPPSEELNVDYESLEQYALLDKAPHLMILPSDLTHFVRDLSGTTVLNPGRLTKGTGPGTFSLVKMRKGEGDSTSLAQASSTGNASKLPPPSRSFKIIIAV